MTGTVALDHDQLTGSANVAERLAQAIRTEASRARSATPIDLPSLQPLEAKARWLDDQVPMLRGLADLAMLLDETGNGQVSMTMGDITDTLKDLLGAAAGTELGNLFSGDDLSLVKAALAIGKWSRMARGVNPVFQTGLVGRLLLPRLAEQGGRVGTWAQWMLSGATRHGGPAVSTGVVWAGAEVVDHWDDISGGLSDAGGAVADGASKAWDKASFWN